MCNGPCWKTIFILVYLCRATVSHIQTHMFQRIPNFSSKTLLFHQFNSRSSAPYQRQKIHFNAILTCSQIVIINLYRILSPCIFMPPSLGPVQQHTTRAIALPESVRVTIDAKCVSWWALLGRIPASLFAIFFFFILTMIDIFIWCNLSCIWTHYIWNCTLVCNLQFPI